MKDEHNAHLIAGAAGVGAALGADFVKLKVAYDKKVNLMPNFYAKRQWQPVEHGVIFIREH